MRMCDLKIQDKCSFGRVVDYGEPIRLDEALSRCQVENVRDSLDLSFFSKFAQNVDKNEELAGTKVKKYLIRGSSAVVFETPEGDVLKLTSGNHFPLNRPQEDFDVPIIKKGKAGKVRYYFEEKLSQRGLSEGFVQEIKEQIKAAGYKCSDLRDYDTFQIGLSEKGKLYLLDPECAKYKTVFHAIGDKCKRFLK